MLTIGITTHNRLPILKKMASSLYESDLDVPYHIRIYDDASTEYGVSTLKKLFPDATSIHRNPKTIKADKNSYLMYQDFLKTSDQYFFNADSDLIFRKDWLIVGMKLIKKTDGVLTLFNELKTKSIDINTPIIKEIESSGAAGMLLSRNCVNEIINKFTIKSIHGRVPMFDIKWCEYLKSRGIRIFSVEKSLVQHIGLIGQNCKFSSYAFGKNFAVDSVTQGQIFNDLLLDIASAQNTMQPAYYLFPFAEVPKKARVIIYGYGHVGINYVNQIKKSGYCQLIGVVDKNWREINKSFVKDPKYIKKWDFDFIVLAVFSTKDAFEIKKKLLSENVRYKNKIIFKTYLIK
ncbi:hypothetical protein FC89_GL000861 [Liquorilactobacillus ghanensis DSM 18630]|uniref:Glycosyltransferase 2-like domain-containing protein n=1 Tax=Liquorilactobacillus ghanensis DSM 18630 TaxID=1423750 RepID=A0A0R1VL29_9LACO|nr:glycosyltransferase [Liquorilactobacillus ghanensis]KRM05997.1 hypothetical protein FC89_GL000861 [Liquorilactobacillus ghanensis DSM 18630]